MPVLHAGWDDDHIAGVDNLNRTAIHLDPARSGGDDEGLSKRVSMPRGPGTGRETYDAA